MAENNQGIGGITFTGDITVNGPMFDIHDNQHVHIHTNGQGKENGEENEQSLSDQLAERKLQTETEGMGN